MSQSDRAAAAAVVRHHEQLASALAGHVAELIQAAEIGGMRRAWEVRGALLSWVRAELLPHAYAEELALYPAAARQPGARLLVVGMLAEHQAIAELVTELDDDASPVAAAAAGRALRAVFEAHLAKENDLIVPLLVDAENVDLAALLNGMHELLGDHAATAHGATACCESAATARGEGDATARGESSAMTPGEGGATANRDAAVGGSAAGEAADGGCGCGGCGCGGDAPGATAGTPAAALTIDPRVDVRDVPHAERHARVLTALEMVPDGGGLVLIAPHAPLPLLAEVDRRYAGQVGIEWLQNGPDVWQVRLHRPAGLSALSAAEVRA